MKMHELKILTGLATLCLAWSGVSYAGAIGPTGYTTVSKASVNIQSYEQTASGVTEKVKVKTDDVINDLMGSNPGTKPAKNLQLVLLNYCDEPENGSALAVWDKDANDFAVESSVACLWTEGSAIFNDKQDKIYQGLDIDSDYFHMDEIDMDVEIKGGKVKSKLISERPVCLKKFKTLTMAGYDSNGDNTPGSRVMRKAGSIKTNGAVFEVLDGDRVGNFCE
jgi:hypothetical protein